MLQLVLAWKSHSVSAVPDVVYAGTNGDDALASVKKIAGKGYVRAQRLVNPIGHPVQIPYTAAELAAQKAERQKAEAAKAELERRRQLDAAQQELQAAQARLKNLTGPTPEKLKAAREAEQKAREAADAAAKAELEAKAQAEADAAKQADAERARIEALKEEAGGEPYKKSKAAKAAKK